MFHVLLVGILQSLYFFTTNDLVTTAFPPTAILLAILVFRKTLLLAQYKYYRLV